MVDDEQLSSQSGAQYLLGFLRQRLRRLPIPDLGQQLEELFVKLRRQPGVDLVSWSNQVGEAYRKLQRSLARTMTPKKTVSVQTNPIEAEPARLSHGSGSEPHREPGDGGSNAGEDPTSPVRSAGQPSIAPEEQEASPSESDHWDWRSWRGWYWRQGWDDYSPKWKAWDDRPEQSTWKIWRPLSRTFWRRRSWGGSFCGGAICPKLSIQASSGNSLKFNDIERAMRQQEDELLHNEKHRPGHHHRLSRSFWVEQEGQWGLLLHEPDDVDGSSEDQVKWLDAEVFWSSMKPDEPDTHDGEPEQSWWTDGTYEWWHDGDEWCTYAGNGTATYSEMKPWLDVEDIMSVDQTAGKEAQDLLAAFEGKVRTFREARDYVQQKGQSRGYYPLHLKGSRKSKGKASGKSKKGFPQSQALATFAGTGKGKGTGGSDGGQRPGAAGYLGCFICGDKGHDWRRCPRRGTSTTPGQSSAKPICFVTEGTDMTSEVAQSPEPDPRPSEGVIYMKSEVAQSPVPDPRPPGPIDLQRLILAATGTGQESHRLGLAVLDTGATETVGSLEAIEYVMHQRFLKYGHEEIGVDVTRRKKFKFGNAEERTAESYLLLPQSVQGVSTSLGIYTLDVPGVPVLVGIKTMDRLGAVVDTRRRTLEFTAIFPGVRIPPVKGHNGHLLLDLCRDWTENSDQSAQGDTIPRTVQSHSPTSTGRVEQNEGDVRHADRSPDFQRHVHAVETQSESSNGGVIEQFAAEDFFPQGVENGPEEPPTPVDCDGAVPGDLVRQAGGQGSGRACTPDGLRSSRAQVQDSAEHRPVRLDSSGTGGPQRSSDNEGAMLGGPCLGRNGQRRSIGRQCPLHVVDVQEVPAADSLHPQMGGYRDVSLGRTAGTRCLDSDIRPEGRLRSEEPAHQGDRPGCCGEVHAGQAGEDPRTKGSHEGQGQVRRKGEGPFQGHDHHRGGEEDSQDRGGEVVRSANVDHQAGERGIGRESGSPRQGGGGVGGHAPSDLPVSLDDESLLASNGDDPCPTSRLEEAEKSFIAQSLREAQEGVEEAFALFPQFGCDLVEIWTMGVWLTG